MIIMPSSYRTEENLGDEPYWETEEGVAECIREYFDAVNKTYQAVY